MVRPFHGHPWWGVRAQGVLPASTAEPRDLIAPPTAVPPASWPVDLTPASTRAPARTPEVHKGGTDKPRADALPRPADRDPPHPGGCPAARMGQCDVRLNFARVKRLESTGKNNREDAKENAKNSQPKRGNCCVAHQISGHSTDSISSSRLTSRLRG